MIVKTLFFSAFSILLIDLSHGIPKASTEGQNLEHLIITNRTGTLNENELGLKFDKIGTLEIIHSDITGISTEVLNRFTNLENLTISNAHMEKTEDNLFNSCCPKLKTLEINNWHGFKETDLEGIGSLPLTRLEILNQDIPKLKAGIFKNTNLKSLSLVRNNIAEIENDAFKSLHNLEFLRISNNKIKDIPKEVLAPLENLETIELVANGIEKFTTENLPELPNLTDIVIEREDLKEINLEGIHKVAPKLSDVFLIGNKGVESPKSSENLRIHN